MSWSKLKRENDEKKMKWRLFAPTP
jgi:hypothetical protein